MHEIPHYIMNGQVLNVHSVDTSIIIGYTEYIHNDINICLLDNYMLFYFEFDTDFSRHELYKIVIS